MRNNDALQFDDQNAFVAFMNRDQPLRPANILNIVAINQGKRPLTMATPTTDALTPQAALQRIEQDHLVVDIRESASFGGGHIHGATNVQLSSGEFEQRVGWVTPLDVPLILVADDNDDIPRALHKLAFLGLDQRIAGYVENGMPAWMEAGLPVATLAQISVHHLHESLQRDDIGPAIRVLDVRETSEWDDGHIESASYMNFKVLHQQLDQLPLGADDPVAIVCATGQRSSIAGSILQLKGFTNVYNVTGGMTAWAAADLPMVDVEGCPIIR